MQPPIPYEASMINRICPCGFSIPKGEKCACQLRNARQRQQANDAKRGTPAQRGYDAEWSKLRFRFLHHNPTCVKCGKPGEHVDHIVSVREAPHRRLDETNLRTLCAACHRSRTARDQGIGALRRKRVT